MATQQPEPDDHEEWMESANCIGAPPDWFFPARGDSGAQAKALCAACAVRDECREYSIRPGRVQRFGVWGGMAERERRRYLRTRRRG